MEARTEMVMKTVYNLLTQDQFDDLESEFENLEVLWNQTIEEVQRGVGTTHYPALELHAGELTEALIDQLEMAISTGEMQVIGQARFAVFDCLRAAIVFGLKAGQIGWPVTKKPCEEVHTVDKDDTV